MQVSQRDLVCIRRRRWRVLDVHAYRDCQVVTVAAADATAGHGERRFIAPFEHIERIERRSHLTRVPSRLWRRACRALIAADTSPDALQSARDARIDLLPHQLEPAMALIRGLGSRVLLADDVGLGKTIQAALIISELRARGAADRVLVITPAGLRDQWAEEMSARFNLQAEVLDVRTLRRLIASLPVGVNPWTTAPLAITSIDYFKRPDVLAAAGACRWDVIVVDEAHGVAGDSDRHAAVNAIARQSHYVILLSGTPHNGDQRTFESLCGIGAAKTDASPLLVFRRTRGDLAVGGPRRIHRLDVRLSRSEVRMHRLLANFSRAVRRQRSRARSADLCLALSVLHKRALSSARSLQQSVDRRLATLASPDRRTPDQIELPFVDSAGELTPADEAPAWSPLLGLDNPAHERRLLGALRRAAARAGRRETKIAALARFLRRANEPAIVFTEYRDTLLHIHDSIGRPALLLHGGMSRDDRLAVIRQFTNGSISLLIATDAAGEGLNLQQTCRLVINLELPWNPTRLEQRIGRVDRIGQRRTVHVLHLIASQAGESYVLSRLQQRVARAQADIGGSDPLGVGSDAGPDGEVGVLARAVIDNTNEDPEPHPAAPASVGSARTQAPQLDSHVEACRIAAARRFVRMGDAQVLARLDGLGPCIANTRHCGTRAALGRRRLTLWQVVAQDGCGRSVASALVPVVIQRDWRDDDERICEVIVSSSKAWRERVDRNHRTFIDAYLVRERAVEDLIDPGGAAQAADRFQPGLFDRRNERAHMIVASVRTADRDARAERLATIGRAASLSFAPPRLVLVLTP